MNNNERELEKAGYDNWKLSSKDVIRDTRFRMGLGTCPHCELQVFEDQLFVDDEELEKYFHLFCFNTKDEIDE